ncbi:hypothetical protein ATANTOWER_025956 [Ataeniobius toweri]|uniref:Uncharacterized protein n=1 Tax=Ataeniobius toweri TaxID=208326 RepID=A0ABU7CBF0_9TELE|nr:hypothetical protein [Ataeniobius toweri]
MYTFEPVSTILSPCGLEKLYNKFKPVHSILVVQNVEIVSSFSAGKRIVRTHPQKPKVNVRIMLIISGLTLLTRNVWTQTEEGFTSLMYVYFNSSSKALEVQQFMVRIYRTSNPGCKSDSVCQELIYLINSYWEDGRKDNVYECYVLKDLFFTMFLSTDKKPV